MENKSFNNIRELKYRRDDSIDVTINVPKGVFTNNQILRGDKELILTVIDKKEEALQSTSQSSLFDIIERLLLEYKHMDFNKDKRENLTLEIPEIFMHKLQMEIKEKTKALGFHPQNDVIQIEEIGYNTSHGKLSIKHNREGNILIYPTK